MTTMRSVSRALAIGAAAATLAGSAVAPPARAQTSPELKTEEQKTLYAIGLAVAWFGAQPGLAPEWRLFVITGLLGGLTTFSTFSAETVQLLQRAQYGAALAMVALHVLGSLTMTVLGLWTVRGLRTVLG